MTQTAMHPPGAGGKQHYGRGCRCRECRDANTAYIREYRSAGRAEHRAVLEPGAAADPGILGGTAAGPAWWDRLAAGRPAASQAELLGIREPADPADGGRNCPDCGQPMRWAGGYTALVCAAHPPAKWARDALAAGRAAEHLSAIETKAGNRIPPAEAAEVAEERAVAADRIAGQLAELDRIPHGDRWRAQAARARHHLGRLADKYAAARAYDDLDDADDDAEHISAQFAAVISYAADLARQRNGTTAPAAERRGFLRLIRRGDGYEYDGDSDDDDYPDADDDDQAPALEGAAAPLELPAAPLAEWDASATALARALPYGDPRLMSIAEYGAYLGAQQNGAAQ